MDRSPEIESFVRRFLELHGCRLAAHGGGVLEAELPKELSGTLGAERLRLAFAPPKAGDPGGAEYVTLGHPLLDQMLELAKSRGLAASLILPLGLDRDFLESVFSSNPFDPQSRGEEGEPHPQRPPLARRLERRLGSLRFAGMKVKLLSTRVLYHPQVMFFFKISFISDEKRERLISLLIDPYTEEIDRPVDLKGAMAFRCAQQGGLEEYALRRLYRRACAHLDRRLAKVIESYQRALRERLLREERRIEEYYSELIQERVEPLRKLFRRMAVASVRADLARSWSAELRYREALAELKNESARLQAEWEKEFAALEDEKRRRIQEVREKHQGRMEAALTHAALVRVPRVEWRLHLAGPVHREITVLYDVLRKRLVDWTCESCSGPLSEEVGLCDCGALVCRECRRTCPRCGRGVCRGCAAAFCHVCGGPVCPSCSPHCPLELELAASYPVCAGCRESECPWCACAAGVEAGALLAR